MDNEIIDHSGGLDVQGPTARQKLFLRRQALWMADLTPRDASWLFAERLKELEARKKLVSRENAQPVQEVKKGHAPQ